MVTIRNIDETFRFYGSFGAKQMDVENGTCFTFPDKSSYIRFWGDLHGFCVAAVDFTPPEDVIFRSQIHQRYLGIGFHEEGHYISYMRKSDARDSTSGISCFVFHSPAPHFLKLTGGQRLRFHGMYFQEQFFQENNVRLYGSFWEDAKRSIGSGEIHSPGADSDLPAYRAVPPDRRAIPNLDAWTGAGGNWFPVGLGPSVFHHTACLSQ